MWLKQEPSLLFRTAGLRFPLSGSSAFKLVPPVESIVVSIDGHMGERRVLLPLGWHGMLVGVLKSHILNALGITDTPVAQTSLVVHLDGGGFPAMGTFTLREAHIANGRHVTLKKHPTTVPPSLRGTHFAQPKWVIVTDDLPIALAMQVVLHRQRLKRSFLCNSDPSYVPSLMPLLLASGCAVLLVLSDDAPFCQCQATALRLPVVVKKLK